MAVLFSADALRTHRGVEGDSLLMEDGIVVATGSAESLRARSDHQVAFAGATIVPGLPEFLPPEEFISPAHLRREAARRVTERVARFVGR